MVTTSVREALNRLPVEGLVDRIDQRGFCAASLDWSKLPMLLETRCGIEALGFAFAFVLRQSIEHQTPTRRTRRSCRLSNTPRSLADDRYLPDTVWKGIHAQFHQVLPGNCPSRWLRYFLRPGLAGPIAFVRCRRREPRRLDGVNTW